MVVLAKGLSTPNKRVGRFYSMAKILLMCACSKPWKDNGSIRKRLKTYFRS